MEFNLSIQRLLLLISLITIFAAIGGFAPPSLSPDSILDPRRVAKVWSYSVLLFITGAVCASVIDHYVGTLDRSNIRLLYILLGAGLMIGSCLWIRGLKGAADNEKTDANKALVPTAEAALSSMLSVALTRHPVSTLTLAPAIGTA